VKARRWRVCTTHWRLLPWSKRLSKPSARAVVQSNTFDPAVEAARCAVRIPVIGVLRVACHFAATLRDRFGLIAPLDSHAVYAQRIIENYRMGRFVSGLKAINTYETGDLSAHHDLLLERMLAVGKEL